MKKINTICFDLDGTLIDTNAIIVKSYQHAFNTHLKDISIDEQTIINQIGPTLQEIFSQYTKSPFKIKALITAYRDYYVKHEHDYFSLYDNVIPVLKILKDDGYNLAIVTSKFKAAAWPSFTHYQLDQFFDTFIALDDVKNPKPSAEPVLKALSAFDHVEGAIMIGDNQGDILAGKNAGIYAAGVAWSIKGAEHLKAVNPDFMLDDMESLLTLLKKY
ncbi:MAG: pyrophosphatase PpaX [Bacillota bacterium]